MKVLWKEWQQQKWLFLIGCLGGISFPILESFLNWKNSGELRTDIGSAVLLVCGVLYAIILSVATTHSDTKKGIDNFWESKPAKVGRLFVTKSLLAAALLLLVFLATISLDVMTNFPPNNFASFSWVAFCYTYPISLMLFAVAMFLVVVIRDCARAVLLSIWIGLLIYFLPLLVGSMEWMNIFEQLNYHQDSLLSRLFNPHVYPGLYSLATFGERIRYVFETHPWPRLLQYFMFLGFMIFVSIAFLAFSVRAMKNKWRWQPGQKTIVWTLGLSAAFIFGIAMTQVGHNLEPVTEWNGKKIVDPAVFDWSYMPTSIIKEGIPEDQFIAWERYYFDNRIDAVCTKDDLMFRVSCGYQWMENEKPPKYDDEAIRHFIVQIYRFPYWDNSDISVSEGMKQLPDFVAGAMRLFKTEPVRRYENQIVLGCFVRGDYLYTAYRPQIRRNKDNRIDLKNMPIYFASIDISNPEKPTLVENIQIEPSMNFTRGFANYGDYCYLSDGGQLVIISVAQAGKPEIVRTIPYIVGGGSCSTVKKQEDKYLLDLGDDPGFPSHSFSLVGDQLLCNSHTRIAILDLAEPAKPRVIFDEYFDRGLSNIGGAIQAVALKDNYLYISNDNGLYVSKLTKQHDGKYSSELVGNRIATPIEKLAGRKPQELLFHKGYLMEASSGFGLIVYNISDDRHPKRVYHAATQNRTSDLGIWNDLIYMQDYGFKVHFFDVPESN